MITLAVCDLLHSQTKLQPLRKAQVEWLVCKVWKKIAVNFVQSLIRGKYPVVLVDIFLSNTYIRQDLFINFLLISVSQTAPRLPNVVPFLFCCPQYHSRLI